MAQNDVTVGERRIPLIGASPETAAMVRLVVPAKRTVHGQRVHGTDVEMPDRAHLDQMSNSLASNITNAMNIGEMLPDIELIKRLLVSSIISPQDMVTSDINFQSVTKAIAGKLHSDLQAYMTSHFTEKYPVKKILPKALEAALFTHGSYPLAVIAENALDNLINQAGVISTESMAAWFNIKNKMPVSTGLLGKATTDSSQSVSFESMMGNYFTPGMGHTPAVPQVADDLTISKLSVTGAGSIKVVDNINVLKFPGVADKIRRDRVQKVIALQSDAYRPRKKRLSMEAEQSKNGMSVVEYATERLKTSTVQRGVPALALHPSENYKRSPVGYPLTMLLPSESIIPVHVPGNPESHVGYFLLLDEYGNPIHRAKGSDYYKNMRSRLNNDNSANNTIVSTIYRQVTGSGDYAGARDQQKLLNSYATVVQNDLLTRLKNGSYDTGVELAENNEIYRIMLSRQLANMNTQLLFVPCEYVTYFAFDYDENGMGRSLVDKSKILATIRTAVMFSNTMAAIRKATPGVNLNIELDPEDQDPYGTVETVMHEYARTRSTTNLFDASSPHDICNHIQNAGMNINVSGNPNYPETKVSQEDRQLSASEADTDYEDQLRKRFIESLGMIPELVDNSLGVEFAQTIVSGNLMMAKQIKTYQDVTVEQFSDHLRKYTMHSGKMMYDLIKIVVQYLDEIDEEEKQRFFDTYDLEDADLAEKNQEELSADKKMAMLAEAIAYDFVQNFQIQLPEPDISKFESQQEAFKAYSEMLDTCLDAYITQDMYQSVLQNGQADSTEAVRRHYKAYFLREWLRRNNVMSELEILCRTEDDDQSAIDIGKEINEHAAMIQSVLGDFAAQVKRDGRAFDRDLEKAEQSEQEIYGASGDSESGDSTESGDASDGGDDFGSDDFGGDDTGGMDDVESDAPAEEEPAEGDAGTDEPAADEGADEPAEKKDDASTDEPADDSKEEPKDDGKDNA